MNNSIAETALKNLTVLSPDKITLIDTDSGYINFEIEGYKGSFIIWNHSIHSDLKVDVLNEIYPDWHLDGESQEEVIRNLKGSDYREFISKNIARIEVEVE